MTPREPSPERRVLSDRRERDEPVEEERREGPRRLAEDQYLSPKLIQGVGLVLLISAGVFWAVTGRESLALMSSAMTLIAVGAYRGVQVSVRARVREEDRQ